MSWIIKFDEKIKKDLKSFDKTTRNFILDSLEKFTLNFSDEYEKQLINIGKIKHLKGNKQDFYRLKMRTYRAIYTKINNELIIYVVKIGHRKDIYSNIDKISK